MATRKIAEVDLTQRRWLNEEEAIGWLNITRPEWEQYIKPNANVYIGRNYDKVQLDRVMEKNIVIKQIYNR